MLDVGSVVTQTYRVAVVGAGTREDPYRPLMPVALQSGEGWTADAAFTGDGTVEIAVAAGELSHAALQEAIGVEVLAGEG